MVQNGDCRFVVALQALCKSFCGVITALVESLSGFIVSHVARTRCASGVRLRGIELHMVRTSTSLVDPTATDAFFQNGVRDVQFNHRGDLLTTIAVGKHVVKSICLRNSAWEPVKNEAPAAIHLGDTILNNTHNNFIRHKSTTVHDLL